MQEDHPLSIWDHLEEFRGVLLKIIFIILAGMVVSFGFSSTLIQFLSEPYTHSSSTPVLHVKRLYNPNETPLTYHPIPGSLVETELGIFPIGTTVHINPNSSLEVLVPDEPRLAILNPIGGLVLSFKVSLWCGVILTSPIWGWVLFAFAAPALHRHERRLILPFILVSMLALALGSLVAWKGTIPLANAYLYSLNEGLGTNIWALDYYIDYTLFLIFANCVAAEIGVIGFFLVHLGIITPEWMRSHRKGAIVSAFILGALLTPPDILTQFLLAIPLILLYEGLILYGRCVQKNQASYAHD